MSTELQVTYEAAITDTAIGQQQSSQEFLDLNNLSIKAICFATEIAAFAKASTQNTIAMCEVFFKAKHELGAEFSRLCSTLNYTADSSTIKKYLAIGGKADLFKPYLDHLPNTWTTLYQMTHLDGDELQQLLASGQINQVTTGKEIKALISKKNEADIKPNPSPRITLELGDSMTRENINSLISELQAMSIEYRFKIEPNATISRMH